MTDFYGIPPGVETREDCEKMTLSKPGANLTVFLLFFGVATLEAFQSRNWIKASFWLAIGIVFLAAGSLKRR